MLFIQPFLGVVCGLGLLLSVAAAAAFVCYVFASELHQAVKRRSESWESDSEESARQEARNGETVFTPEIDVGSVPDSDAGLTQDGDTDRTPEGDSSPEGDGEVSAMPDIRVYRTRGNKPWSVPEPNVTPACSAKPIQESHPSRPRT